MIAAILASILSLIIIYAAAVLLMADLSVKKAKPAARKALFVFPHPDDEVISCGGLMGKLSASGAEITLLVLTKGERGTPDAHEEPGLKGIRARELEDSGRALGAHRIILKDFGDGRVYERRRDVEKCIREVLATGFDIVVTFDPSGIYGHPDHVAVSDIVTRLSPHNLWYVTLPDKHRKMLKLPDHMAKDPKYRDRMTKPNRRVFIGLHVIGKIRAMYMYRSQLDSFKKSFSIVPLWLFLSIQLYEYYHEL